LIIQVTGPSPLITKESLKLPVGGEDYSSEDASSLEFSWRYSIAREVLLMASEPAIM